MEVQNEAISGIPRIASLVVSYKIIKELRKYNAQSIIEGKEYTGIIIAYRQPGMGYKVLWLSREPGEKTECLRTLSILPIDQIRVETGFDGDEEELVYCGDWHSHLESNSFSREDMEWFRALKGMPLYQIMCCPSGWRYAYHHNRWGINIVSDLFPYSVSRVIIRREQ